MCVRVSPGGAAAAAGERRRRALFGWNILVRNLTVGALFGYSSVNSTLSLNVPSSHAVSSGLCGADKG